MEKAIMLSDKPKWVCKILNGDKNIEVRSKFPKDFVGWVYIYNTKDIKDGYLTNAYIGNKLGFITSYRHHPKYRGKVVARFWCDKVDDYVNGHKWSWENGATMWGACYDYEYILKDACLTDDELRNYVDDLSFSAIHISKLEIFDKPKEISEFKKYYRSKGYPQDQSWYLTKAPQHYCYVVEGEMR